MEGSKSSSLPFALLLQLLLTSSAAQAYMLKLPDNVTAQASVSINNVPDRNCYCGASFTKGFAAQLCTMHAPIKCSMIELLAKEYDGKFLWKSFQNVPLDLWGNYEREFYDQGWPDGRTSYFISGSTEELEMRRKDGVFSIWPKGHPEWSAKVPEPRCRLPYGRPQPCPELNLFLKERFDYELIYTTFTKLDV